MRNGRDKSLIYWKLNYKGKFIRTLWMIPVTVLVLILFSITDISTQKIMIASLIMLIVLIPQLIYNYLKWKKEPNS